MAPDADRHGPDFIFRVAPPSPALVAVGRALWMSRRDLSAGGVGVAGIRATVAAWPTVLAQALPRRRLLDDIELATQVPLAIVATARLALLSHRGISDAAQHSGGARAVIVLPRTGCALRGAWEASLASGETRSFEDWASDAVRGEASARTHAAPVLDAADLIERWAAALGPGQVSVVRTSCGAQALLDASLVGSPEGTLQRVQSIPTVSHLTAEQSHVVRTINAQMRAARATLDSQSRVIGDGLVAAMAIGASRPCPPDPSTTHSAIADADERARRAILRTGVRTESAGRNDLVTDHREEPPLDVDDVAQAIRAVLVASGSAKAPPNSDKATGSAGGSRPRTALSPVKRGIRLVDASTLQLLRSALRPGRRP